MHFIKRQRYNTADFIFIIYIINNKTALQKTNIRVLEI